MLSLTGFFVVGVMALNSDEELVWAVCKALGAFIACWIAFNYMGAMLFAVVDNQKLQEDLDSLEDDPDHVKRG